MRLTFSQRIVNNHGACPGTFGYRPTYTFFYTA